MNSAADSVTFLRYRDLTERNIVANRTTLSRWMRRQENPFPKPIRLGPNTLAWRLLDIESWMQHANDITRTNHIIGKKRKPILRSAKREKHSA
jgi:predicted DNA-binding transcriptional regulator AlpA